MFKNIKIKTLIIAAFGSLTLLMVAVGGMGIYNGRHAVTLMRDVVVQDKVSDTDIARIRHAMEANRAQVLLALQHNPASEHAKLHDHPVSMHLNAIADNTQKIDTVWADYSGVIRSAEEKKLAEDWRAASGSFGVDGIGKAVAAIKDQQWEPAVGILLKTVNPAYNSGQAAAQSLSDFLAKRSDADTVEVVADLQHTGQFMIALLVLGVLFAAATCVMLLRAIAAPLAGAIDAANRVAKGDLTQNIEVHSNNEIGQLLHAMHDMADSLGKIVTEVRTSTETVASASNQIVAGNLDLSSRTEQQAASVEETASSMEQMTATVRLNADHAREANELARSASAVAVKGGEMVGHVVDTMESINESARKIADIIGVIDGIAFQTNILALNAAVEAARAGEQGRGFAVVASEVRNLAQRSASAAKEIKELIGDSVERVGKGSTLVGQTGKTMEEIVAGITKVADIMGEITNASDEQTAGIGQINSAIAQMDQTTQQNAALVEESSAAAQSMRDQAARLTEVVSVFKLSATAGAAPATAPHVPQASIIPIARAPSPATPAVPAKRTSLPQQQRAPRSARVANADWEEF